jgi:hypothetical protein
MMLLDAANGSQIIAAQGPKASPMVAVPPHSRQILCNRISQPKGKTKAGGATSVMPGRAKGCHMAAMIVLFSCGID